MTEWFTVRFDTVRSLNFESCPGEQRCSTKETARIYRFLKQTPDREIEEICKGCPLLPTKPGTEPEHLARAIQIAGELDEDSTVCEGFDYPAILDYLDPFEWACLVAIKAARRISESKSFKNQREEAERAQKRKELENLSYGRSRH